MEPDGFRLALNSLVQALRNVTWLLQKQKADLPNFGAWYPAWQESVKTDPIMGWVVKARNRIVKEADLELFSTARLTVSLDWLAGGEKVFHLPPRHRPVDIAAMLLRQGLPEYPAGEGTLTIARRWVDRLLPDHELLDACDHAYGSLVEVIRTAHLESGVSECDMSARRRECVNADLAYPLDCIWTGDDIRTADFDLGSLVPYVTERRQFRLDPVKAKEVAEKYGLTDIPEGDAIARVPAIFRMASTMLERDGHAVTTAMIFRGDGMVDVQAPNFEDQAGKMLAMRELANRVRSLNADGFLLVGEMWTATAPREQMLTEGFVPARKRPDRREALQVTAITKDGRTAIAVAAFEHGTNGIVIEEPRFESWDQRSLMSYRPIFKAWGIEVRDPRSMLADEQVEDSTQS